MQLRLLITFLMLTSYTWGEDCNNFFSRKKVSELAIPSQTTFIPTPIPSASVQPDLDEVLKKAQQEWPQLNKKINDSWVETDFSYKLFFNPKSVDKAAVDGIHPLELYPNSLKQYLSFKNASKYLNEIPIGNFLLSEKLIINLQKIVMENVYRVDEKIGSYLIPFLVPAPGEYKYFSNFGFSPLTKESISEEAYQSVLANPDLKFIEVPFKSRVDKRVGLIKFPDGKVARTKLLELIDWYNENKNKIDAIELAAKFQRRFISLHPFYNGNGRTSRLIMDRILAEANYPPAILEDSNLDLYVSEEKWISMVKTAVAKSYELASKVILRQPPFAGYYMEGTIPKVKSFKDNPLLSNSLFPDSNDSKISIGQTTLILFKDGFFYSNKGIPYVLKDNKFYPIADFTYYLYTQNGKLFTDYYTEENYDIEHSKRKTNQYANRIFQSHIKFLKDYQAAIIKPTDLEILPYSLIEKANNAGDFFLYPWQKEVFQNAITIRDYNAMAILCQGSGQGQSSFFEVSYQQNKKYDQYTIEDMLAQYQMMELQFYKYQVFARKEYPEFLSTIQHSREKLFLAAKEILKNFYLNLKKLNTDDLNLLKANIRYKLFEEYLSYTALHYESFEEANEKMGDEIVLLRSDLAIFSKLGFFSEANMRNLLSNAPFSESLFSYLRKKSKEPGASTTLTQFVSRVLYNPYRSKGLDEESKRVFVKMIQHANNTPLKNFLSFSSSIKMYTRDYNLLPFISIYDQPYKLFFMTANKNNVINNISSMYAGEYELLISKYSSPFQILKSYTKEELNNKDPGEYISGLLDKTLKFDMSKISIK